VPVLAPEDHDHFVEHGFVALRQAVPTDTIAAALRALEADDGDRGRQSPAVAACTTDTMLDAIAEIFGTTYTLRRRRGGTDMPRPHEPGAPWPAPAAHVDDSYPTIMPNGWAVGSFTFLTPVRSLGGAFVYFAGSYRRYRELLAQACHCIKGAAQDAQHSGPPAEFLARPGDVLLFHHLMGHTGSTNVADPVTRHALLNRWHPEERIVPGRRCFDDMSTIEKANSARYLSERRRAQVPVPEPLPSSGDATLRRGFADWEASPRALAVLHFGGHLHLLVVEAAKPTVVRHLTSDDFLGWQDTGAIDIEVGPVRSVQLHQYVSEAVLAVITEDDEVRLYVSEDFETWTERARLSGCHTATPWFTYAKYPSKVAGGQTLFLVPASDPARLLCRWGEGWHGAGDWTTQSVALQADGGARLADVTIAAHFADSKLAARGCGAAWSTTKVHGGRGATAAARLRRGLDAEQDPHRQPRPVLLAGHLPAQRQRHAAAVLGIHRLARRGAAAARDP
jgi:hypothetical protein